MRGLGRFLDAAISARRCQIGEGNLVVERKDGGEGRRETRFSQKKRKGKNMKSKKGAGRRRRRGEKMRKKQQRWRMERGGEERRREEKGTRFASPSGDSGTHYGGR